jgi:hypothetical protein
LPAEAAWKARLWPGASEPLSYVASEDVYECGDESVFVTVINEPWKTRAAVGSNPVEVIFTVREACCCGAFVALGWLRAAGALCGVG